MELHFLADVLEEFQMFLVTRVNTGDLFRIQVHLSHLLDTSFKANPHKFRGVLEEYFVFKGTNHIWSVSGSVNREAISHGFSFFLANLGLRGLKIHFNIVFKENEGREIT